MILIYRFWLLAFLPGGRLPYFCIFLQKVLKSNAAYERANDAS